MRVTDQRARAVWRRTTCEVNKNNMRVLNAWRSEIDDEGGEMGVHSTTSEAETNWEVEATSE